MIDTMLYFLVFLIACIIAANIWYATSRAKQTPAERRAEDKAVRDDLSIL